MKLLSQLVKQAFRPAKGVETARVAAIREGQALLETSLGQIWARCGITVDVGSWVTYGRSGNETHVLGLARRPGQTLKTVRV